MSRRKTNLKKRREAKKQKTAMMIAKYETDQMIKNCLNHFTDVIIKNMEEQEFYRWN